MDEYFYFHQTFSLVKDQNIISTAAVWLIYWMQAAFVKSPKGFLKKADQSLWFYLWFDTTEEREIKLALFQTHGRGVPKLHHHGLLALERDPLMCLWFSAASYKR